MVTVPRAVEIELPSRSRVHRYTWLDEVGLAFLNGDAQQTRDEYAREPSDWVLLDILACQLIGLSAGRIAQERGYDARDYIIEAEEAILRARRILKNGSWNVWADERLIVLRAVAQYNMAILLCETGNVNEGLGFMEYVRENLGSLKMQPNQYCDELRLSLAAEVQAFDEFIAADGNWSDTGRKV